jgi:hypothetical protein
MYQFSRCNSQFISATSRNKNCGGVLDVVHHVDSNIGPRSPEYPLAQAEFHLNRPGFQYFGNLCALQESTGDLANTPCAYRDVGLE